MLKVWVTSACARFLPVVFFALGLSSAKANNWNLNDVSYLYSLPLNSIETTDHLLKPIDEGILGPLLSREIFNKIPTLNNAGNGQTTTYEVELKVVGVRFDPCPQTIGPVACQPEIRLVWQPIQFDSDIGQWTSQDASVHTFYRISRVNFEKVKATLLNIKKQNEKFNVVTNRLPLGVHPGFLNAQTRGSFIQDLNSLIKNQCGDENLYKVTFMRLLTHNIWWRFGGLIKHQDQWNHVMVPRLNMNFQDIFNSAQEVAGGANFPGKEMDAIFNIQPETYPAEDDLTTVVNHGFRKNNDEDLVDFKDKISAIERFQNPKFTSPNDLDCASCHFADSTRFYVNSRFPELTPWQTQFRFSNPDESRYDISNSTIVPRATRVVRAFGYFGSQPAINQRVINDSVESAEWLNRH